MHTFLFGFGAGILVGGALSYLYAQSVIKNYKALAAGVKKVL